MSRWTNWLGPLDCTDNLKALKEAYEIGVMEMPAEVYKETGYQLNQFLDALIPGLIQALIALAASTALGGAIGAVVGAFFGGAGAIPGAMGGAAVGFDLGLAVLGWLGLGFLAYSIGHSLGELTALLELAVRRAWDAPNSPQPRTQIRLAGKDFARSGAILIRLVLQGIAMWLTQKGVNKIGELVAELRKSKLGPRFAAWVEENAAALMRDPRLKPHRGQGSAAKEVVSEAQSPSRLANRRPDPVQEAAAPPNPASVKAKENISSKPPLAKTSVDAQHLAEMQRNGVKFTPENVVATGRDAQGKVVFLEEGTPRAGLKHIVEAHADDFANIGVPKNQIPDVVMKAATQGKVVGYQGAGTGRPVYEILIDGKPQRIAVTTGNNGFIVGANPAGGIR